MREPTCCELDYKVVKQEPAWHAPARHDEVLELTVSVLRTGRCSFTLADDFRIAGTDEVIANAVTVRGAVDAKTMVKNALPPGVRETPKKGALGMLVDHAGYLPDDCVFS